MRHDIRLAGPSDEEQAAETQGEKFLARNNTYKVTKLMTLIKQAWAHHNAAWVLRKAGKLDLARLERGLAWDAIIQATPIREKLLGEYYA